MRLFIYGLVLGGTIATIAVLEWTHWLLRKIEKDMEDAGWL